VVVALTGLLLELLVVQAVEAQAVHLLQTVRQTPEVVVGLRQVL
jgi:hypothetical protein